MTDDGPKRISTNALHGITSLLRKLGSGPPNEAIDTWDLWAQLLEIERSHYSNEIDGNAVIVQVGSSLVFPLFDRARAQIGTATGGTRMLEMVLEAERYIRFSIYGGGISGVVDKGRLAVMCEPTSALAIATDVADLTCQPVAVEIVEEAGMRAIEVSVLVLDLVEVGDIPALLAEPLLFCLKNVERAVALSLKTGCLIGLGESLKAAMNSTEVVLLHSISTGTIFNETWSRVGEVLVIIDGIFAALLLAGFVSPEAAVVPTIATGAAVALDKARFGAKAEAYLAQAFERLTGKSSVVRPELPEVPPESPPGSDGTTCE